MPDARLEGRTGGPLPEAAAHSGIPCAVGMPRIHFMWHDFAPSNAAMHERRYAQSGRGRQWTWD